MGGAGQGRRGGEGGRWSNFANNSCLWFGLERLQAAPPQLTWLCRCQVFDDSAGDVTQPRYFLALARRWPRGFSLSF